MTKTKQSRLLEAFTRGERLTAKQIASRFQIANPRATVSDIRRAGYTVEAVQSVTKSGAVTTRYSLAV